MEFLKSTSPEPHKLRHHQMLEAHGSEIKKLYGNNPFSFFFILLVMVLHLAMAYWLKDAHWTVILLGAYAVGAFLSHALYVFLHEATHNLVFKTTFANRLVGIMCDWFLVFPGSMAFRKFHLMHHYHQGDYEQDADIPAFFEARLVKSSKLMKLFWVTSLGLFQALRPMRFKEGKVLDGWVLLNLFSQIAITSIFYVLFGWWGILYLLLSTFFCLGLHPLGGRWIAEHYTAKSDQETFSYYGPVNLVMFNIGYHNEHHDFMSIPWNNLPKLKALAPEYYNSLKSHHSYTKVLWDFLTKSELNLYSRVMRDSVKTEV